MAALEHVTDFPALVDYLRDELDWPIAEGDFDKLTFSYTPEEVGLDSAKVGGGIEILQLRPIPGLPFGIFFVNLPKKHLSITLMRTLLGSLAPKKRASANPAERAVFAQADLMFIAATGEAGARHIDFAHFRAAEDGARAAPLKVLGWDADDTDRRHRLTGRIVRDGLHWPDAGENETAWRTRWTDVFKDAPRYPVTQAKALAEALADLARRIRDRAVELMAVETDKGALRRLHAGFKEALIHDLTPEKFADYYAQTITYGLFSARVSRPGGIAQDDVHLNVAGTSPFLKDMLAQFLEAGGRKAGRGGDGLDFDALGVGAVVDLLDTANMDSILADWGHRNQDEDPVVHFYQDFLNLYDPGEKKKRGVFYTPKPVVSFIVRSVDEVLRTEFGLGDGLASTATWGEVIASSKGREGGAIALPEGAKESDPFVRILDPATGTGTFLVECVDLIHRTMIDKWKAAGKSKAEIIALWNVYVPDHLLPRLTGFELMMAPYAIAHVKLGLKLADTGYAFGNDARAQIYLTNALEPAQDLDMQLAFMSEALAHEAKAANKAKETRFTVVVGNPPYSKISGNLSAAAVKWVEPFRYLDGERIIERGALAFEMALQDDYVKFWGFANAMIGASGAGIAAYITNFRYLDGRYLRGLRQSFLTNFSTIAVTNLGGQVAELHASKEKDENVFDIEQGVAVAICTRQRQRSTHQAWYRRVFGTEQQKYENIGNSELFPAQRLRPASPDYFLVTGFDDPTGDPSWPRLETIFQLNSGSIITSRDALLINMDQDALSTGVTKFANAKAGDEAVYNELNFSAKASWNIEGAKASVRQAIHDKKLAHTIREVAYRPFDKRYIYFDTKLIDTPSKPVSDALYGSKNLALLSPKVKTLGPFTHVFVADVPAEKKAASHDRATQMFALYKASNRLHATPVPAIAPAFAARVAALTGLTYDDCVDAPKQGALAGVLPKKAEQIALLDVPRRERGEPGKSFGPRDLFDYIYAVLHSPAYRARYADYLKSDFARIPLPGGRGVFEALAPIGAELVALHLLDADALPILQDPKPRLAGSGDARVSMPAARFENDAYDNGRMYIAVDKSRWFEPVPAEAADFHVGGYRPARKWLKDRAAAGGKKASPGRVLSDDDVLHYRRMIATLTRTAEVMPEIDAVIESHGGWPGAFRGMSD